MKVFASSIVAYFQFEKEKCQSIRYIITSLLCLLSLVYSSQILRAADFDQSELHDIRIVMSGAFVSETGTDVYNDIAHYLSEKLNRKVVFISGFSYTAINSMLESGMADIAFICGLPYVMQRDVADPAIDILLAPIPKASQYKNKPIYYSYLIVHKDSNFKNFSDLRGSTFVYNDEISNSGYNMPRAHLIKLGETRGFFKDVVRSGSHEESIRMVALGTADVSAVDSLVYDYDLVKNPEFVQRTRILKVLGPAGTPPVVASKKLSPSILQKITNIFLGMNNDPAGKIILENALLDRFSIVNDSNYDSIRDMRVLAQDVDYMVIR